MNYNRKHHDYEKVHKSRNSLFRRARFRSSRFEIKAYLKSDLALLYFPCLSSEAALRKLRRWINFNPSLHRELYGGPEGKNDQLFSRRQVAILVKYLDAP